MPKKSVRKKRNTAERSDPALWDRVKKKVIRSPKGGPKGKWSARKAQLAVALYKKSGGKYIGKKSKKNSLVKWTKEKWGYIDEKRSDEKYGRYLPLRVRQHLTPAEKRTENRRKGTRQGKHIPYSKSVLKKFRKYR
jgi:hypothetical protein